MRSQLRLEPEHRGRQGRILIAQTLHQLRGKGRCHHRRLVGFQQTLDCGRLQVFDREQTIGKLADEKVGLEKKIEDLRKYEREYRGRLKSWISDQLSQLDDNRSQPVAVTTSPGE